MLGISLGKTPRLCLGVDTKMVDTSFYPQAPAPLNPLEMASQAQAMQTRGVALEQAQLQLKAQQALGPLMQQSVGEDGQPDLNKFIGLVAASPDASFLAPQIMQQALQRQLTQEETLGKHLDNQLKKYNSMSQLIAPLSDLGKDVTLSDVTGALALGRAQGLFTNDDAMGMLANVSASKLPLHQIVQMVGNSTEQGRKGLENALGTFAERHRTMGIVGRRGEPRTVYEQDVLGRRPLGGPVELPGATHPASNAAAGGGAPAPTAAARPGGAPQLPPAALGMQTGLSPEEKAARAAMGTSFAKETELAGKDMEAVRAFIARINDAERLLKDFKPGPGREWRQNAARLAYSVGLDKAGDAISGGDDKKAYAAAEQFQKQMLSNSIAALRRELGGGQRITNMEVDRFMAANPSIETTPQAIKGMFDFGKKLAKLAEYRQQAMSAYKATGKADLGEFNTQFHKHAKKMKWLFDLETK